MAAIALVLQPFVTYRPNRIASGKSVSFLAALPQTTGLVGGAIICTAILVAFSRTPILWRAIAAFAALAVLIGLIGLVPLHLVPPSNTFARVSPSSGFWLLILAFALLAADTLAKLKPGPWVRLLALAGVAAASALILCSGWLRGISILKEYASHADTFWTEATKHVELAVGSLAGAVIVGVPLGIACARLPHLRAITLPVLNVIQTIPSIAMYGLMMVPLGLLAARLPLLSELGIRGIGTAPAAIALFLYSLLPVVANTVIGLDQVSPQTSEAARGMGMSGGQRLLKVELPLATPIILTGIRIVLVQNIGLVTVAALIGGGGLGSFVFQGIGQSATDLVLLGTVPIIALAFVAAVLLDAAVDLTRGAAP
ncbi:ABC transporter permease [Lichenifustis flavocetrariae]|uniref:ABC transporter permease n=1 Tax=Lichenifustis flavocetrariae TaxID=2949735 RepID=A0AA41YYA3_9HYPH|nr:ABC transporter permease [Lichenifustis flavocetrariae]MCW6507118.1 ABC transporter permease [Lichenifustis flavocetrariae]